MIIKNTGTYLEFFFFYSMRDSWRSRTMWIQLLFRKRSPSIHYDWSGGTLLDVVDPEL